MEGDDDVRETENSKRRRRFLCAAVTLPMASSHWEPTRAGDTAIPEPF